MNSNNTQIIRHLVETGAFAIAPPDQAFWYTSGSFGPYYINTHYLYGGKAKAENLLGLIDRESIDPARCTMAVAAQTTANYEADEVYRSVIDAMVSMAGTEPDGSQVDAVSGGERRDWFFSFAVARRLGKPHLAIFKDGRTILLRNSGDGEWAVRETGEIAGMRVLHVADLVREASSYLRAWIPAVRGLGGRLACSIAVVDRDQGGCEALLREGIRHFSLARVDLGLFEQLSQWGLIDRPQHDFLCDYHRDPEQATEDFLACHPDFLASSISSSDERVANRSRMFAERGGRRADPARGAVGRL